MGRSGLAVLGFMLAGIVTMPARAQANDEARWLAVLSENARRLGDLDFPSESTELDASSNLGNGLFRPVGMAAGRSPALVLAHNCGGIRPTDIRYWLEAALQEGYVVLVVDSMRGHKNNCRAPLPVPNGRRLKDLYDAIAHLAQLPFVDPARIAEAGFSQGAMMAALLASPKAKEAVAPSAPRYAASVGLYGACQWPAGTLKGVDFRLSFVFDDSDRPLLYLMGGDDRETPAEYCEPLLSTLKAKGAPIESHVYAGSTHCWDCQSLDGFSKIDHKGDRVHYRYDKPTTEDSRRRVFDFLARRLKK